MKAAIYIRVSTERQSEEGYSMEAQHDLLMDLLNRKGMELYRVYSDPGISGKTMSKRPGMQQLLTDLRAGKFEAIMVHKLDRLSRNLGDLYDFIALVNKLNTRLVIASLGSEEIDTISPMGKAFLYFNGIFAEIYSDNLREETLKGLTKKMSNGGLHMSVAPLGYEFEIDDQGRYKLDSDGNKILSIVSHEAALVREVFELYLQGKGVVWIAKHMNGHSRGKKGGVWDSKYVKIVLVNRTYRGQNHFKPADWDESRRIITEGAHVGIISPEDFDNVQKMMIRKSKGQMSKSSYDYPYGGIVRCEKCGATYIGNSSKQKLKDGSFRLYKSYRCRNAYSNNTCDAPSISEKALNQELFKSLRVTSEKVQEKRSNNSGKMDRKKLQKEIDLSNRRRKNWMMALGDGKLEPSDYASLMDEEEARISKLTEEFQEESLYVNEHSEEEIKDMMVNLKDNWDLIEADIQKQLIQSMFRKITIKKESNGWEIVDVLTV
ncbi:recombinase family protein [Paenibacillus sp. DMB5]|uniref:recombinase family protein n=1 Tax=Paenibacillus sp. DMB5 TaxID=1780103 RepID=UPI00076C19DF|nr:recombinase family protein [Paenibacillus sp. DMB5]KUP24891.1 hypothetical protein AWJ19_03115 [Paenibacillus sp. DMB5]